MKKTLKQETENIVTKSLAKIAMCTAAYSANGLCAFIFHQPSMPKEIKKLRRF